MACFEGQADVLSIAPHTLTLAKRRSPLPLAAQDAAGTLDAVRGLFAAPEDASLRPAKRRKLNKDNAAVAQSADIDERESLLLAKVSLELLLPTLSQPHTVPGVPHTPLALSLESYSRTDSDAFQVVLYHLATSQGVAIAATARGHLLDSIDSHIRTAAALAQSHNGKRNRLVTRAAFCRCLLVPPTLERSMYRLEVEVRWTLSLSVVESPVVKLGHMKEDLKLLARYFPAATAQASTTWALSDFYDSVYVPPADLSVSPRITQSLSETSLYPFQQRAVDWLLRREGVAFSPSGALEAFTESAPAASFKASRDASGRVCYVSQLRGMAVTDLDAAKGDTLQSLRGGILAEEMGLGKTVELIALMSHHKRVVPQGDVFDTYLGVHVKPSQATLIITPPSILEQWISEVNAHAPELTVLHYKGVPPPSASKKDHAAAKVEYLLKYDIVVTTYNVLAKEIHYATPPPDRSFRSEKRHVRRKSPLVEISWWRVCLDEAQMIESGVSQAAKVARIIPRCNAWAVSGTPLRKDVQDLRGLLTFLRCDAFANNKVVWDRLDKASFRTIFSQIALRHTKDKIRDELRLPPQKRVVITVPFTTIEEQNYSDMIRQMCDACWLSPEGNPVEDGRDTSHPEVIERMREWLVRLRQTCLHAHVGRKNRKALGAKNGALRTVHEVLEVMIDQNDATWKSDARAMILHQVKLGHITAYAGDREFRSHAALPHYEEALRDTQAYVSICKEELAAEQLKVGSVKEANYQEPDSDMNDEREEEHLGRIPAIRKTLRSFLELEHACSFFIATTHHQIKENEQFTKPDSEEYHRLDNVESEWYQKAKVIRRQLLKEAKVRAQREMNRISSKKPFHQIPTIKDLPNLGGIESRQVLDAMDNISDFLNAQAEQCKIWRMKIVDILLTRLVDDDDDQEITGEEYDDSLKAQDELYVYSMALRTLVADRNTATHGLHDLLADEEMKAAVEQAKGKRAFANSAGNVDRGHAPELVLELAETRRKLKSMLDGESLKGVVSGVRSLITTLQWKAESGDSRSVAELDVVKKYFAKIQDIATQQAKTITELEKEQEMFRATMNQRLEYYRQFQYISDTVAKWKEDLDDKFDVLAFTKHNAHRERTKIAIARAKTKHTYLNNLRSENQHDDKEAECVICQDFIEIGVLTTCGHKYCKECINTWWHQHRTCPMCKQKLGSSDFRDISFKPGEMKAQEETPQPGSPSQASTPGSSSASIYTDISDSTMKEIKTIDLEGSYGTKVDTIARHLVWLRANDPGSKSVIFSQFSDFLEVLREALKTWKIGASGITDKDGIHKFKTNPSTECFLLDAKSDSSGLNLVNATYVFLCEPLINPAIELQAIARVHRIGQQRPTTVFMYLIADTVEEAIYDISVARRLEHIKSSSSLATAPRSGTATPAVQEQTLEKANSAELQAAPLKALLRKKGNGEEVKEGDLWHCLFGKQRKVPKPVLEREVDRHLRAEAAEGRVAAMQLGGF